jgi:hypothetical protein
MGVDLEVGAGRRRYWTTDEKRRIVEQIRACQKGVDYEQY